MPSEARRRASEPLKLELQTAVNHHVVPGILGSLKSSPCSLTAEPFLYSLAHSIHVCLALSQKIKVKFSKNSVLSFYKNIKFVIN